MVTKLPEAWQRVGYQLYGMFKTVKACLILSKHRHIIGRQIDAVCLKASVPAVLELFARHALNSGAYITGSVEEVQAAWVHVTPANGIIASIWKTLWDAPGKQIPTETCLSQNYAFCQ